MSKRNTILFITILILVIGAVWGFMYLRKDKDTTGETTPTNFLVKFNPFKTKTPTTTPGDEGNTPRDDDNTPGQSGNDTNLKMISSMPVAGFGLFSKERITDVVFKPAEGIDTVTTPVAGSISTEFALAVRYVEKATGNIYQSFVDKIDEQKFSQTLVPRVQEALLGKDTESVVMRSTKYDDVTILSFAGNVPKENMSDSTTGNKEITGAFLSDNITDMSMSPDKSQIFFLLNVGENAIGSTSGVLGDKKIQVFDSPFTEWLSQWPNKDLITLTTKPSANVLGYMYAINPTRKDFNRVMGDINGLTTLTSPTGKLVLWTDSSLSLEIFNTETKTSSTLGIKTLPEKCVWSGASDFIYCSVPKYIEGASYPDAWYMGKVSFSDEIWKIDVATQTGSMISDMASAQGIEDMDNIKLALDQDENYLFFINKKDSHLWELKLK